MTETEAAVIIRDAMKADLDLARAVRTTVELAGCQDHYEWVGENPSMAIALATQLEDINSQIGNMEERLSRGDLT